MLERLLLLSMVAPAARETSQNELHELRVKVLKKGAVTFWRWYVWVLHCRSSALDLSSFNFFVNPTMNPFL